MIITIIIKNEEHHFQPANSLHSVFIAPVYALHQRKSGGKEVLGDGLLGFSCDGQEFL